jgi:hypothetical protein
MKIKRAWTVQSFFICIVFNGVLAGLIFLMATKILEGLNDWVSPFMKTGAPNLPDEVRSSLNSLGSFLAQLRQYLAPALAAMTSAITLLLWFCISLLGRRQINRASVKSDSCEAVQKQVEN